MPRILVTGGAGYIGSHTVMELENSGFETVLIDNFSNSSPDNLQGLEQLLGKPLNFHEGDCQNGDFLIKVFEESGPFDAVMHFAAYKSVHESVNDPMKYYKNNVGSLIALLQAMDSHKVNKLVFSSSCSVYGSQDRFPVSETDQLGLPESPYAWTKQVSETIIQDTAQLKKNLHSAVLRYFNPVGAHSSGIIGECSEQLPENLIPRLAMCAAGELDHFVLHGADYDTKDGSCIRDYLHVTDLAKAHIKALKWLMVTPELSGTEIFNLGSGQGNSVLEVIKAFEEVSNATIPIAFGPRRKGDVPKIYASTDKARLMLGWEPTQSLENGLRDSWNRQLKYEKRAGKKQMVG